MTEASEQHMCSINDWHIRIMRVFGVKVGIYSALHYTMYPPTAIGSSLAVNDRTMDVRVMSDRPSTP